MFEVIGATILFIFIGDCIILGFSSSDSGYYQVLTESLYLSLAFFIFIVELLFNGLTVRFDQYPAVVALLILYLMIIWPIVFTGRMKWPYSFLETSTFKCFLFYSVFIFCNFLVFVLWASISQAKWMVIRYIRASQAQAQVEGRLPSTINRRSRFVLATGTSAREVSSNIDDFSPSFSVDIGDSISEDNNEVEIHIGGANDRFGEDGAMNDFDSFYNYNVHTDDHNDFNSMNRGGGFIHRQKTSQHSSQ